ncbi:MAG: S8 family serine peptidase [Bacteroidales bacterium]|jgi:hypothetical protein|nr:S8 family serine peptidase [Bacteroidales bacterium]
MKNTFHTILLLLLFSSACAQEDHWIFFTDKNGSEFNPYTYFDPLAIERRVKQGISLYDSTDFPLAQSYVDQIARLAEEYIGESRWFNAVAVSATAEQLQSIAEFPFVRDVVPVYSAMTITACDDEYPEFRTDSTDLYLLEQLSRMAGELFHHDKINGKGIRIAIFDAGFTGADEHAAFQHLRDSNRIVKVWNFARKNDKVYRDHAHGRMVLSCVSGIYEEQMIGLATGAEFLLAKTETIFELKREEIWWLEAVEWADKNGAHIINSSLGYTGARYTPEQMDGRTSIVSRAANIAAAKGILVVNAAGNSGTDKEWLKTIATPADADSVLTVGGISPFTDYRIPFSSKGPTADNRLKPNVVAYGWATVAAKTYLDYGTTGTSFASPLVAGFAACVWQLHPEWNAMKLKEEIEKSADLYPYFDYDLGYGVPQASYFLKDTVQRFAEYITFEMIEDEEEIRLEISTDRELLKDDAYFSRFKNVNYLFYHIQDAQGVIQKYYVFDFDLHTYKYQYEYEEDYGLTDTMPEIVMDAEKENRLQWLRNAVEKGKEDGKTLEVELVEKEEVAEAESAPEQENKEPVLLKEPVKKVIAIHKSELKPGYVLRARFNGEYKEYRVE